MVPDGSFPFHTPNPEDKEAVRTTQASTPASLKCHAVYAEWLPNLYFFTSRMGGLFSALFPGCRSC